MIVMEGTGGGNWYSLKASMVSSMVLKADSIAGAAWAEGILLWWFMASFRLCALLEIICPAVPGFARDAMAAERKRAAEGGQWPEIYED